MLYWTVWAQDALMFQIYEWTCMQCCGEMCIISLLFATSVYFDFFGNKFQLRIVRDYSSMQIDVVKVFSLIGRATESTWSA